jgi:hypothetical protein
MSWVWWEAVARLERIRQLAGHDYRGASPSRNDLWWQVCRVHLVAMGVER